MREEITLNSIDKIIIKTGSITQQARVVALNDKVIWTSFNNIQPTAINSTDYTSYLNGTFHDIISGTPHWEGPNTNVSNATMVVTSENNNILHGYSIQMGIVMSPSRCYKIALQTHQKVYGTDNKMIIHVYKGESENLDDANIPITISGVTDTNITTTESEVQVFISDITAGDALRLVLWINTGEGNPSCSWILDETVYNEASMYQQGYPKLYYSLGTTASGNDTESKVVAKYKSIS